MVVGHCTNMMEGEMAACVRVSDASTGRSPTGLARIQVDELGNSASASEWWRRHFESLRGRRATIFVYIFIFHIYQPLKNHYTSKYGQLARDSGGSQVAERRVLKSAKSAATTTSESWHWRTFPRMWRALIWYRKISTIYMAYVVLKNLYPPLLEAPLRYLLLDSSKPVNCYLVGRYLPNVYVRRASASLFAGYHLIWRFFQVYKPRPNYMISTLYFLLLDDRDIINYYKLLARTRRTQARANSKSQRFYSEASPSKHQEAMVLDDIMSARVDGRDRTIFKLRPNRTPEASRLLRKHLVDTTLIWLAIFILLATIITLVACYLILNSERYFEDYPGCSPGLKILHDQGQLNNGWHLHLRWHQLLAQIFDLVENFFLWSESGIAGVFSIPFTMWLNYDLVLYWEYLDDKVTVVLKETRENHHQLLGQAYDHELPDYVINGGSYSYQSKSGKLIKLNKDETRDNQIYQLQMEWQDFIKQIKHSDAFIGDATSTFIFVWFTLFGLFVYDTMSTGKSNLPLALNLVLSFMVTVVTLNCAALLVLHRHCSKSYTKLCSLMAYDRSEYRRNFIRITEYFMRKQTCYILYRGHKMTATTCLTIIGWSFSCFFILGNVRKNYYN